MPPATVLFVCTGNICRSPLAAAYAHRALVARNPDLEAVGLRVTSAGIHALAGRPATPEMQMVAAEIGLDLSEHRASQADPATLREATLVYGLEMHHVDWLRTRLPVTNLNLLGELGIDDPYGSNLARYRRIRGEIMTAVQARLPQILSMAG